MDKELDCEFQHITPFSVKVWVFFSKQNIISKSYLKQTICSKTIDSLKMFSINPENGSLQITVPISFVTMRHCYLNKREYSKDCIPNKYNLLQKIFNCPSRPSFRIENKKVHKEIFIAVRRCFSKRIKYNP